MSVQALAWVFEFSELTGVARCVVMVIANRLGDHAGDEYCYPSLERIAREARCSVRAAQDALRRAEAAGEIEAAIGKGPHGTNVYRMPRRVPRSADAESAPLQIRDGNLHPNRKEPVVSSSLVTTGVGSDLAPTARKRDPVWDVLVAIYGEPTSSGRGSRNAAAKTLRDYGATPEDITGFVASLAGSDRDWAVTTPTALAKHFGERLALIAQVQNGRRKPGRLDGLLADPKVRAGFEDMVSGGGSARDR